MRLTLTYERPGNLPVAAGIVLVIVGAVRWKTGGLGPLGRLPGDIIWNRLAETGKIAEENLFPVSGIRYPQVFLPHRHLPACDLSLLAWPVLMPAPR